MSARRPIALTAALCALAVTAAACGGPNIISEKVTVDSGGAATMQNATAPTGSTMATSPTETNPELNANAATGPAKVSVELAKTSDFSLEPSTTSVPAGKVTFTVHNAGTMVHEMVVVKTDKTPAQLALPDGTADESTSVGEAADIAAGATKSVTLNLPAGKYILLCNIPGHYKGGMHATFTATKSTQPPAPVAGTNDVAVALAASSPFSLVPAVGTVKAGPTRFIVSNYGTMTHEMVVVKTDKTPKQLMEKNGTANESTSVGEASDLAAGETKTVTIDLKPGRYILLCNLPGHYKAGMYHTFVVQ